MVIIKKIKRYLTLELMFIRYNLARAMEFRTNFIISFLTVIMVHATALSTYAVVFITTNDVGGWNASQITFLMGTSAIIDGFFMAFIFFNLTALPTIINNCELDFLLLKPVNPIFMVSFRRFDLGCFLGNIPLSIVLITYSMINLKSSINLLSVIIFFIMVADGIIIYYSLFFIIKCLAFFFTKIEGLDNIFWTVVEFGRRVPGTIYPAFVRALFIFLVPVLVIVYFPAGFMLNKLGYRELLLSVGFAAIALTLVNLIWKHALKRYNSASS